mmetsp:Transcript_10559/g.23403  ORF Transcript_10559/g.23403 Transcript_10559/m.23403 type:complete len:210 (+) Transcript_10559:1233-1862(+)
MHPKIDLLVLRQKIQTLVVHAQCLFMVAPLFIDNSHITVGDTSCQECSIRGVGCLGSFDTVIIIDRRGWGRGRIVFVFILQSQFVYLHCFFKLSSLNLDITQQVEQHYQRWVSPSQHFRSNAVGNGVHLEGSDPFSRIFVLHSHFHNVRRVLVRIQNSVSMIQGHKGAQSNRVIFRIFGLFQKIQSLQVALDRILISKVHILGTPSLVE